VHVIRTANVRDSEYQVAERQLIQLGPAIRETLQQLLVDPDLVVRERAAELLKKLTTTDSWE
jgi:hypothetical protein